LALSTILLLTGEAEAPILAGILRRSHPTIAITPVTSTAALKEVCAGDLSNARLVSFCSSVIVPEAVLKRLPGPAYNFHPGPPDRPGRYPAVFAIYENAARFGVTVHEMIAAVDAGPIVTAEWFDVPPACDLATLEGLALTRLAEIFRRLASYLTHIERPLPRMPIPWRGRRTTRAECEALCTIAPGLSEDEIDRRRRACGTLAS
jgi:methionyl-tRNA formyltransferase